MEEVVFWPPIREMDEDEGVEVRTGASLDGVLITEFSWRRIWFINFCVRGPRLADYLILSVASYELADQIDDLV